MSNVKATISGLIRDEAGATAVEYALMVALIALVVVAAVTTLGTTASTKYSEAASGVANAS